MRRRVTVNAGRAVAGPPEEFVMPTARDFVNLLLPHRGEKYVFGALARKEDANYHGPWDCAEFVSWGIYQAAGEYVGCRGKKHDAYTGYFSDDLPKFGTEITEDWANSLIGAICLRPPGDLGKKVGHIAVCEGGGLTIEAMDTKHGVRVGSVRDSKGKKRFTKFYVLDKLLTYEYMCSMPMMPKD